MSSATMHTMHPMHTTQTSRMSRACLSIAVVALLLTVSAPATAQDFELPTFSPKKSHFPNLFGPYAPQSMGSLTFQDSARIEDLIRDGVLYISLQDAIYLALENNLDIAVQRYGPALAQTDLLSAKGGGIFGAFDPVLSSTLSKQRSTTRLSNLIASGVPELSSSTATVNVTYDQAFKTGTQLRIQSFDNRQRDNSPNSFLNPQVGTSLGISITQPLLNGFGFSQNLLGIKVSKNNVKISDQQFAQQVMDIVSNVKRAYWELVFSRENTQVAEQSLALAEKLHEDNRRQVEIGTLAPLELVRAEAEVARTRQQLIVAQTGLLTQQIILKDMLSRNPGDPLLALVEVEPLDQPQVPIITEVIPIQDAIQIALQKRPEISSQQIGIKNLKLQTKSARRSMLPSVDLFGSWTNSGLAGNFCNDFPPPVPPATCVDFVRDGFDQSATQTLHGDNPSYNFGVQISIPLRNRSAQAAMARSQIEERRAETQYKRLVNTVIVDVRNSQIGLQQSRSQIDAATKARELAEETLRAEEKRFQLGASTIFLVIQAQRDLALASSNEVRAQVDYQRAMVDFDRALGRTLERSSITLQEAKTGLITAGTTLIGSRDGN